MSDQLGAKNMAMGPSVTNGLMFENSNALAVVGTKMAVSYRMASQAGRGGIENNIYIRIVAGNKPRRSQVQHSKG
jgi:hypothetical protein